MMNYQVETTIVITKFADDELARAAEMAWDEWCSQSLHEYWDIHYGHPDYYVIMFASEIDATAFKLRFGI